MVSLKTPLWIWDIPNSKKTKWMQLQDHMLRLIALCMWHFHHAVWVMDHAGILLTDEEAQEGFDLGGKS